MTVTDWAGAWKRLARSLRQQLKAERERTERQRDTIAMQAVALKYLLDDLKDHKP